MQVGQDDSADVPPRVNLHIVQTCADLFVRRYFDVDFLREKRVPTRQITGYGVPSGVARIDDEATFGVLDQPAKNRPTHPELVEKNVQLALQCRAAVGTAPCTFSLLRITVRTKPALVLTSCLLPLRGPTGR